MHLVAVACTSCGVNAASWRAGATSKLSWTLLVVIHASEGVATSAQAMAWCMGGSPFVYVYSHALEIFSDPPSVCGDSVLKCFIDCVCFSDPILMIVVVVTCAHYACVADCADAMADAWEDTAGCAQAICLHENLVK